MPDRTVFGVLVTGPSTEAWAKYLICLIFVTAAGVIGRNLTRGALGRRWMAIRDMDIAAEIIGVNPLATKLSAFAISGFFVGVAGALFFAVYLGAVEVGEAFGIQKSFLVLFMIIIGGLGSIFGSFAGAAFMVLLPVLLKNVLVGGLGWDYRPCRAFGICYRGRADCLLSHRRTAWFGAALAAGKGKTAPLAIPTLTSHYRKKTMGGINR